MLPFPGKKCNTGRRIGIGSLQRPWADAARSPAIDQAPHPLRWRRERIYPLRIGSSNTQCINASPTNAPKEGHPLRPVCALGTSPKGGGKGAIIGGSHSQAWGKMYTSSGPAVTPSPGGRYGAAKTAPGRSQGGSVCSDVCHSDACQLAQGGGKVGLLPGVFAVAKVALQGGAT